MLAPMNNSKMRIKGYLTSIGIFSLALGGWIIYLTDPEHSPLIPLLAMTFSLLIWAFSPSHIGDVKHRPSVSTKELKEYRRQHPGTSIAEAIEATRQHEK